MDNYKVPKWNLYYTLGAFTKVKLFWQCAEVTKFYSSIAIQIIILKVFLPIQHSSLSILSLYVYQHLMYVYSPNFH